MLFYRDGRQQDATLASLMHISNVTMKSWKPLRDSI